MSDTPKYDPTKTDEPQAIKNPAGDARPVYDQYEVNQPSSTNAKAPEAGAQGGYGNGRDEDGHMEQEQAEELPDPAADDHFEGQASDNPPGGEGKPVPGEISDDPAARAKADAARPLGGS
ncbi:hypothetical protein [Qipengyuania oceanensis]|uniref:Uncharacterized protein n=1 Tax=Qipengyuania oceanensis TaxID=1463597 RepID=A0A844YGQ6_9SPHN|nr:hypothetical protein [Qipengyuania oceanensis]MXO63321.1 hypothetical protein [Qipengyuania oceanensis]